MNEFIVVMTGRDCHDWAERAMDSVAAQKGVSARVCVVDDASEDKRMGNLLLSYATANGWAAIINLERKHVLANQVAAWKALEPQEDDVVVFVDLDDQLAHPNVLNIVKRHYDQGAWMTYGSYVPNPSSHPFAAWCRPALSYPDYIVSANLFRSMPPHFNHLRTIGWKVLKHVTDEDLRDNNGEYWQANADASVMIPCLELSGQHTVFVEDVLYKYTCNNAAAVWRTQRDRLNDEWRQLRARQPKNPL